MDSVVRRKVVACDAQGHPTGTAEIVAAHTLPGLRHLAFSVYLFSPDGTRLLIQRRASAKMLWPLVWANTCCSHPRPGEEMLAAARRRLGEELGLDAELTVGPAFEYRAVDPAGRGVEHEYDITLMGTTTADPTPNPAEVAEWRWIDLTELRDEMRLTPDRFAPWLQVGLPLVLENR